ncbi:unnamed protein product [Caenorhabditis auriculariae]|uniref:Multifunctional fusion protein n=1 Tax=Caenorhabditis auriculariae TaxID=2777116 RepID=A0A8S1HG80_9PELO|nr:unnamed protein product [Caenorhabditis auriculariae]
MNSESPSNCNYCYSLECSVRVEPSTLEAKKMTVSAKTAIVSIGRNSNRQILLQVELINCRSVGQPVMASYLLADAVLHQQLVTQGKASVEIPSRHLVIRMSNCPPRKLNVFIKSLQAKLDILRAENGGPLKTPVSRANLLSGLPKIRRLRGVATGKSPMASGSYSKKDVGPRTSSGTSSAPSPVRRPLTSTNGGLKRLHSFPLLKTATSLTPLTSIAEEPNVSSDRFELSPEQKNVVRLVVQLKQNVFFTGSAGTGKSLILRRIIEMLPAQTTFITAATGVAACQLGGVTLHSFAGIGVARGSPDDCLRMALAQKHVVQQWKKCCHLIIDEISMIDEDYFSKLDYVAREIRNKTDLPFGGIQLIITGDFLQLPPVSKGEPSFCFESPAWRNCIQKTVLLKQVRRQDDVQFIKILQKIRLGECDTASESILKATSSNVFSEVLPTRLCTHTNDSQAINISNLNKLEGNEKNFLAIDDGQIPESLQSIAPKHLVLKVGAQVMLTKNIDLFRGLSNGSRGSLVRFSEEEGNPVIHFAATSEEVEIRRVKFQVRVPGSEISLTRRQLPLQLAWAISIHKSQGLTLDAVEMSLSRIFAPGQAYVALSRARSLSAIKVLDFDASCVRANAKVVDFYSSLIDETTQNENSPREDFIVRKQGSYVCVNCLCESETLYQKYSADGIKLTECKKCGQTVDKYIEFDSVLVVVHLILQYIEAYRHLLCNVRLKKPFRLGVLFLFCHSYDKWIRERTISGDKQIYELEMIFYESVLSSILELGAFVGVVLLFDVFIACLQQRSIQIGNVIYSTLFGFYGNVAVVLSIVFRLSNQSSYRMVVQIFLFVSHVQVQRVLFPRVPIFVNALVISAAHYISSVVSQFVPRML